MVLPLLLGLAGSGLASAGMLGTMGPLLAGSIGSGLGAYAETGDLEKGIMAGLGSFAGGKLLGPVLGKVGGGADTAATALGQGTKDTITAATAAAAGPQGGIGSLMGSGGMGDTFRGGTAWMKTPTGLGQMAGTALGGMAGSMFGQKGEEEDEYRDRGEMQPIPRQYMTPPTGYRPGIDPEWNYGISTPQSANALAEYNGVRRFYGGGVVRTLGPIKLAQGGIASLGGMDAQEHNTDAGVDAPSGGNEKDVVAEAIRAIKGEVEDPRIPLGRFLALYGEDALRDLVEKVQNGTVDQNAGKAEGEVKGPGDGMDDRIPAKIKESGEDVLLADSEYVVPADVVSGLGNGSSDAGAKVLDDMLDRVRMERTGKKEQAKQIDPKAMVPA